MANRDIHFRIKGEDDTHGAFSSVTRSFERLGGALNQANSTAGGSIGVFGKLGSAIGGMATVAGGIITANLFGKISDGLTSFVSTGLNAVGASQQLEASLNSLFVANNMYAQSTEQVTTATTKQLMSQAEFIQKQDELRAKLNYQRATLQEQKERVRQLGLQWGETGLDTLQAKAKLEQMEVQIRGTEQELAGLTQTQTEYSTSTTTTFNKVMGLAEAQQLARKQTQQLMDAVSKLAVVSPFETEQVELVAKYAVAAGLGAKEAEAFTGAFMDMAASVGIGSESLGFAADQLLQVKKVGQLTTVDLRQLRRMGIDLEKVIGVEMAMSVDEFNAKAKATPEIFDQLFEAMTRFSQNTFAGTSKAMAQSVKGIQSTLSDVFTIGAREFFRPLVEAASPMANDIVGKLSDMVLGGGMADLGKRAAELLASTFSKGPAQLFASMGLEGSALFLKKLTELFGMLSGEATTLGGTLRSTVGAVFEWLSHNLFPTLTEGVKFIIDHFEEFKGALMGIGAVLAAGVFAALAAAVVSLLSPLNLLIAGAALLGAAWAGNWGDIQGKTAAAWATIQPILQQLITWLQTNIPIAIQATADFWTTTLQPALQQVGNYITTTIIPTLMNIWTWLATNIPAAIDTVSGFWTGTLLPAIRAVNNFTEANLLPLMQAMNDFFVAVLGKTIEASAGLWQNVLLPALEKIGSYLAATFGPAFEAIGRVISEKLGPPTKSFSDNILPALKKGLDGVTAAIKRATDFFKGLADAVQNFQLPPVLTPGSPTPFEIALKGIAAAAAEAGGSFDGLQAGLDQLLGLKHIDTSLDAAISNVGTKLSQMLDDTLSMSKSDFIAKAFERVVAANRDLFATGTNEQLEALLQDAVGSWKKAGIDMEQVKSAADKFVDIFRAQQETLAKLAAEAQQSNFQKLFGGIGQFAGQASSEADILNEKIATLQTMLRQGGDQFRVEGQILNAAQAQDKLNGYIAEQVAMQEDLKRITGLHTGLQNLQEKKGLLDQLAAPVSVGAGTTVAGLANLTEFLAGKVAGEIKVNNITFAPTINTTAGEQSILEQFQILLSMAPMGT